MTKLRKEEISQDETDDSLCLPQLPLEQQIRSSPRTERTAGGSSLFRRLVCDPVLQFLSIFLYVSTWVANGESLQGISNGTFCPNGVPYDKPAFLTWLDYNLMAVGFIFLWPWIRRHGAPGGCSFWTFFSKVWVGTLELWQIIAACIGLSFLLTACHIFYMVGLQKISVASLNAAYQVQAACTLGLSVFVFGGHFVFSEIAGILISLIGIAAIVIPPLLWFNDDDAADDNGNASSSTNNPADALVGTLATMTSAALWGCYQVAWRALYERKNHSGGSTTKMTRTEELVDTIFTLAVIGVANLTIGWIVLPFLDWIGFETFELPPASMTGVLTINAVIEYAFNAFCVIAIHMTSPVATSLTAPLTIPLSWVADWFLYKIPVASASGGGWGCLGAGLVVVGVSLMELKPTTMMTMKRGRKRKSSTTALLLEAEMKDYITFLAV